MYKNRKSKLQISASDTEDDIVIAHISKLECQEWQCIDPLRNRGGYRAVGAQLREFLDNEEMVLPTLDFLNLVNFGRSGCLEASLLTKKLTCRESSRGWNS